MSITRVRTVQGVAEPVGAFSQAVIANGFVFTSGQIPAAADGSTPSDFEGQLEATLQNLRTLLDGVGSGLNHVVKVTGYLTDVGDLETYNRIYRRWFGDELPARTTVCVSIWGIALELECVAVLKEDQDA